MLFDFIPITFVIELDDDDCEINLAKFASFFYKNMPSDCTNKPDNIKKAIIEFRKRIKYLTN
jgi:hypothetical protein